MAKGIWNNAFKGSIQSGFYKANMRSKSHLASINTNGVSTMAPSITNAILAVAEGRVSAAEVNGAAGKAYHIECKSGKANSNKRYVLAYYPSLMKVEAFVVENGAQIQQDLVSDSFTHWAVFVPRLVELLLTDAEAKANYQVLVEAYQQTAAANSLHEMFVLNDIMYTTNTSYIQSETDVKMTMSFTSVYEEDVTDKLLWPSDFAYAESASVAAAAAAAAAASAAASNVSPAGTAKKKRATSSTTAKSGANGTFELGWDKEPSDEEKLLIPTYDLTVMKMHKRVEKMIRMVKDEHESSFPVNNVILYGEGGAGKSTAAKLAAQMWGLPYRFVNLSLNSEESDIIGSYRPKADGSFEFFEPAFAKAFRSGGVIEIMEINYARPGALGAINSGLDDTAQITLGNGEVIKRHPNCVIIATTNVDYAGCQKMNEALKDRFQQLILVEKLSNKDLADITIRQSGNSDVSLVTKMIDAVQKISIKMVEEQISGGVCSTRQLINWARDVKYTNNPIESAKDTILPGVALDLEIQREIIDTILKPMF